MIENNRQLLFHSIYSQGFGCCLTRWFWIRFFHFNQGSSLGLSPPQADREESASKLTHMVVGGHPFLAVWVSLQSCYSAMVQVMRKRERTPKTESF